MDFDDTIPSEVEKPVSCADHGGHIALSVPSGCYVVGSVVTVAESVSVSRKKGHDTFDEVTSEGSVVAENCSSTWASL